MFTRKLSITLLIAVGLVAVAAAPHYRKTLPQVRCTIPNRDYQFKGLAQPVRSVSAVGIPLRSPVLVNGKSQGRAIQTFQFVDNPVLQIDHCFLSKMSVLVHENGWWTVSFQADQNPVSGVQPLREVTTAEPPTKITAHILRNKFDVRVTCYGRYGTDTNSQLGKAIMVPLDIEPFWVQRSVPFPFYARGYDERIEHHFDLIDRVEIEFTYRVD